MSLSFQMHEFFNHVAFPNVAKCLISSGIVNEQ